MKRLLACAVLVLNLSPATAAQSDALVVTVNGTPITVDEVAIECDNRINASAAREAAHGLALEESSRQLARDTIRAEVVAALIERALIAQQLTADEIAITDAEVDAAFEAKAAAMGQTPAEARRQIESQGRTLQAVKNRIRHNILGIERLYLKHAQHQDAMTEAEARKLYDEYPGEFDVEERRRASHILIRVAHSGSNNPADKAAKSKARERAEHLLARVNAGEDFAALAAAHSDDVQTAAQGGDRGFSPRGIIVDESTDPFGNAAFALASIGDTTGVVESPDGFHIIKLTGLEPARRQSFDEVKQRLIDDFRYREIGRFWEEFSAELHASARIEYAPAETERQAAAKKRQEEFNAYVENLIAKEEPQAVTGPNQVATTPTEPAPETLGVPTNLIPASR
jgi:parvulin-like peptidyl-prolyl isomerase